MDAAAVVVGADVAHEASCSVLLCQEYPFSQTSGPAEFEGQEEVLASEDWDDHNEAVVQMLAAADSA